MPSFCECFIITNRRDTHPLLQRVKIAYADEMSESDPTPSLEPDVGTWSVQEHDLSEEETPIMRYFHEHVKCTRAHDLHL
jgi:hypothetical protein